MKRIVVLSFVAVLMLVSGCAGGQGQSSEGDEFTFVSPGGKTRLFYPPGERGRVHGLSGESLLEPGKKIGLQNFPGQVVVINIWGSWCPPCRAEVDDLQAVQNATAHQGVRVLGIDVKDNRTAASDFVRDRKLTYPSIYDESGRSLLALKGYPRSSVPSTIVLDRQHRVAAIFLTEMLSSELLPEVQKVAAERPRP